jgi:transcriptional regulator with XRE-family HTH domain
MTQDTKNSRTIHQGRNVKRFREMLGIKQDTLATMLDEDWTQVNISRIEQKEIIDGPLLQQISAALKIPVEAILNFDEAAAIAYINTFNDGSTNHGTIGNNYDCTLTFNPLDKMIELYERMLLSQREMIEKLERLIEKKD